MAKHGTRDEHVVLITGSGGFTGRHLVDYLNGVGQTLRIIGFDLTRGTDSESMPSLSRHIDEQFVGDIRDFDQLRDAVIAGRPRTIIHLAGAMPSSASDEELHAVNVGGASNLLEAALEMKPAPRVLVIGSAAEYGPAETERIHEDHPCRPTTTYGRVKLEQTRLCQRYAADRGLPVVAARPFNLFGPGMSDQTVIGEICAQIARANDGDDLILGNLSSARDFMDIRDAVAAYWLLSQHGTSGEVYNVCRGQATVIQDLVDMLRELAGKQLGVRSLIERRQSGDVHHSCGECGKLEQLANTPPKRNLIDSLQDTLAYFQSIRSDRRPRV